ncbi:MAG: RNA polymerase sigma-70 factor [Prolixibacteraceae bacterium]|nr:RNA polymerase sigma-70 factor [Prolixibacteraceae bacterium]
MKNATSHNEQQLISLLRGGSQDAFEQLFDSYSQKLYRFSYSYLKAEAEAEEIVQDVFLKLWENRDKLRNETSFQSYLFTIAFNAIRKHFNKKTRDERFRANLLELLSEENPSLENHSDFETLVARLDQLIEAMPSRRKEIFLKRKKEGKSISEIALDMDISPKTVENQITEAMNYLKKEFGNDRISGILFFCIFLEKYSFFK